MVDVGGQKLRIQVSLDSMERDYLERGIRELSPWFHRIGLPGGLITKRESVSREPPDHPLPTRRRLKECMPGDLSEKTVLDVGCNAGFYSQQTRIRNARSVLGIYSRISHIRQARFAARANGLDRIHFERMSVYESSPSHPGVFDLVLALGLVYHLKHLILGLEKLYQATGELLILETAVAGSDLSMLKSRSGNGTKIPHPIFHEESGPSELEASRNWFIPVTETIQAMLLDVGFSGVEIIMEFNGRAVLTARKSGFPNSLTPRWLARSLGIKAITIGQYLVSTRKHLGYSLLNVKKEYNRIIESAENNALKQRGNPVEA